jgi:hypothetical protein
MNMEHGYLWVKISIKRPPMGERRNTGVFLSGSVPTGGRRSKLI